MSYAAVEELHVPIMAKIHQAKTEIGCIWRDLGISWRAQVTFTL